MNKTHNFNRYSIIDGKLYSNRTDRYLSHKATKNGYCLVTVYDDNNNRHTMLYGKLMLILTDYRPDWKDFDCGHKNGNPLDDRLENLEWQSHQQNCKERKPMPRRDSHSFVVRHLDTGKTEIFLRAKDIPADYPVPYITLASLASGKEGRHTSDKYRIAVWWLTDAEIIEAIKNPK